MDPILDILVLAGAALAALAVCAVCGLGLVVWVAGRRPDERGRE